MHHSSDHPTTTRSLWKVALCAVAAAVLLAMLPADAGAASPRIEGFPTYRPQTRCSPKAKPGTVMLADYLMRHYKGSGSLGISRSCAASGVSEHKEGRAFDWALDANSSRDRGYAADFLHRLRKTDRFGHPDALARRMGIMYVIWSDHIYSATYHYKKRPYLSEGCRTVKRCSVTLRHRNHMHISLTRAAAQERTSWYEWRIASPRAHKTSHTHKVAHKRHHRRHRAAHRRHHKVHHHAHHRRHHRAHRRHHKAHHHAHRHHRRHRRAGHRSRIAPRLTTVATTVRAPTMRRWSNALQPVNPGMQAGMPDWSNVTDSSEDAVSLPQAP